MDCSYSTIFYVVHLIWEGMEKGHTGHTNTKALSQRGGWIFFLFKKCQLDLIYDMQSTPSLSTPLVSTFCLDRWNRENEKIE